MRNSLLFLVGRKRLSILVSLPSELFASNRLRCRQDESLQVYVSRYEVQKEYWAARAPANAGMAILLQTMTRQEAQTDRELLHLFVGREQEKQRLGCECTSSDHKAHTPKEEIVEAR